MGQFIYQNDRLDELNPNIYHSLIFKYFLRFYMTSKNVCNMTFWLLKKIYLIRPIYISNDSSRWADSKYIWVEGSRPHKKCTMTSSKVDDVTIWPFLKFFNIGRSIYQMKALDELIPNIYGLRGLDHINSALWRHQRLMTSHFDFFFKFLI